MPAQHNNPHPWKEAPPPQYTAVPGLDTEFANLVRHRGKIQAAEEQIKKAKEENSKALEAHLTAAKIDKVRVENFTVTRVAGKEGRSSIDGHKLLELGVPATTIQKATKVGAPGKGYVLVTDGSKARARHEETQEAA